MNSVSLRVSRNQHKTSWKVSEEFAHVGWSAKQSSFRVVKRHEFQARLHMLGQRADWAMQRDPVSERMLSSASAASSQHLGNQAQLWVSQESCTGVEREEQEFRRTISPLQQEEPTNHASRLPSKRQGRQILQRCLSCALCTTEQTGNPSENATDCQFSVGEAPQSKPFASPQDHQSLQRSQDRFETYMPEADPRGLDPEVCNAAAVLTEQRNKIP